MASSYTAPNGAYARSQAGPEAKPRRGPNRQRASPCAPYCTNSATTRKTITLIAKQYAWVKARIEGGDCTNDSEYIRDLIRRDQEQSAKFQALQQSIQDGLESGVSDRSVVEIWADAEAAI